MLTVPQIPMSCETFDHSLPPIIALTFCILKLLYINVLKGNGEENTEELYSASYYFNKYLQSKYDN